jgi:RNA polymerase sigma-70 factor (ECF subfamily)
MGQSPSPQSADTPDASLLAAIAEERSTGAFQALFLRYAPRLKSHYLRSVRSEAQAEDLVQDVFVSIWNHAHTYQADRAAVSTWIFRIARNRYLDTVRRQRFIAVESEPREPTEGAERDALDEMVANQQLGARVAAALEALPMDQAEVVQASYFLHESASQTAARLAIPVGTVKSRLRAALSQLRQRVFAGEEP